MTYDLRGNIITLQRNGLNSNGWTSNHFVAGTYGRIDNLTYAYNTKNQLLSVNEASLPTRGFKTNPNATGNQYDYDANGNLISDKNKYITSIEYNYLNLPIKVVIDNPTDAVNSGSIEFIYDATGTKLRKTVKNKDGSVKETWDYVNGVEYKNQILQRVAHSEGAVVRNDFGQYQHEYVLRDHLGNTRVTFTDGVNKGERYWDWSNYSYIQPDNTGYDDGVVTEADIKHINHTYPFGMAMEGNWNNAGAANNNRYLYNGKQYNDDFGLGWYDFGARFYNPSIAQWTSIDPLAESYKRWSPYNYCKDNPVKFFDPDGRGVSTDYYDQKGKKLGDDGNKNGKVVVITNKNEAKSIKKIDKEGGTTAESSVKSGVTLPSAYVRAKMGEAVARSNQANDKRTDHFKGDDKKGGFHEEGGEYGSDAAGNPEVVEAKPGAAANPTKDAMATVDVAQRADPKGPLISRQGSYHVHPAGKIVSTSAIGGSTASFNQSPTPGIDYGVASSYSGNSYVLGAGDNTVTIHNGTGDLATFPLDQFISIGNK